MGFLAFLLVSLPLFVKGAEIVRRDDPSDGGGDPNAGGFGSDEGLSNWVDSPNHDPLEPVKDPFYTDVPHNLSDYKNGQVISRRAIGVSGTYQGVGTAVQMRLRSQDAHGSPAISLASILVPLTASSNGNIVVFQIPEDANYLDCAPTYQLFSRNVVPEIQSLIQQGFSVVVPDYEGTRGSFTVGRLAGKQILDASRAALSLHDVFNSTQEAQIGLWGYGTGAHATGWAAELKDSYAPELPIRGVALGGLIANLENWIEVSNGSPNAASAASSLLGMASEYKDVSDALSENVLPRRKAQFEAVAERCLAVNTLHLFNTNITSTFFAPGVDIFSIPKVRNVYQLNDLGKTAPKVNLLVYHGSEDTSAPIEDVHNLLRSYCSNGSALKYYEIPGASHAQARGDYEFVLDYLSSVTTGIIPPSACSRIFGGGV